VTASLGALLSWCLETIRVIFGDLLGTRAQLDAMKKKKRKARRPFIQYGALPYRESRAGVEILLVTSRGTRKWIIPKGWPQRGRPPHRAAAVEAFEEAGVVGKVRSKPIGHYRYQKKVSGSTARFKVRVFPLRVTRQLKTWPERRQRRLRWHSPALASRRVSETRLKELIRSFARQLKAKG
jgi:8-oxo-dGTP pyrophosphatase MutT (NUDIX family)